MSTKNGQQSFAVCAAFVGECCMQAHALVTRVSAPTQDAAEAKLRKRLEREGKHVGDVFYLPSKFLALAAKATGKE